MSYRLPLFVILLIIISFFFGCAEEEKNHVSDKIPEKVPSTEKTAARFITEGGIYNPRTLNPLISHEWITSYIGSLIFNSLFCYAGSELPECELAESYNISSDSKVLNIKLKKNVLWHNGKNFTSEDVRFTYEQIMASSSRLKALMLQIDTVEVRDSHNLIVRYNQTTSNALRAWTVPIFPSMIFQNTGMSLSEIDIPLVGTGPFRFLRWDQHEQIVLEANPSCFSGPPASSGYIYKIIPDWSMAFLSLKKGDIHMLRLNPDQFDKHADTESFKDSFELFRFSSESYTYLGFNLKNPLFSSRNVRLALTMSVNREEMISNVLYGYGKIITGPFPAGHPDADPDVQSIPYDPVRAGELLSQDGWIDQDGDGIREKDGQKFQIEILTNNGNMIRKLTASVIRDSFSRIGVEATVVLDEWGSVIDRCIQSNFSTFILGFSQGREDSPALRWHSVQIPGQNAVDGENYFGFSNPEVDRLLDLAQTSDFTERKNCYRKVHRIVSDEAPCIFLFNDEGLVAISRKIKGITASPSGYPTGIKNWTVE